MKKKLLNNPLVMAGLIILAGISIYFNVIAPILGESKVGYESNEPVEINNIQEEVIKEEILYDKPISNQSVNNNKSHKLKKNGWNISNSRNPFYLGENIKPVIKPTSKIVKVTTLEKKVIKKRFKKSNKVKKINKEIIKQAKIKIIVDSSMIAIILGDKEEIILAGGRHLKVGDDYLDSKIIKINSSNFLLFDNEKDTLTVIFNEEEN